MYQLESQLLDFTGRSSSWTASTRKSSFEQLIVNLQNVYLPANDRLYCLYCAASLLEDDCASSALPSSILCHAAVAVMSVLGSESSECIVRGARHLLPLLEEAINDEDISIFIVLTNTLQKQLTGCKRAGVETAASGGQNALSVLAELQNADVHSSCSENVRDVAMTTTADETLVLSLVVLTCCVKVKAIPFVSCIGAFTKSLASDSNPVVASTFSCLISLLEVLPASALLLFLPKCFALLAQGQNPTSEGRLISFLKLLARQDLRVGAKLEPILTERVLKSTSSSAKVSQMNALVALADLRPVTKKSFEVSQASATKLFQVDPDVNVRIICLRALRSLADGNTPGDLPASLRDLADYLASSPQVVASIAQEPPLLCAVLLTFPEIEEPWLHELVKHADLKLLRGCLPRTSWAMEMLSVIYETEIRANAKNVTSEMIRCIVESNCFTLALRILADNEYRIGDVRDLEKLESYVIAQKHETAAQRADRRSFVLDRMHECDSALLFWLYVLRNSSVEPCCLSIGSSHRPVESQASMSADTLGCHRSLFC